eukprot:Hpha_TRINITY_DN15709_c5_g9::TRINITY_DN15709_c5_g9_i1::g.37332::m.37332
MDGAKATDDKYADSVKKFYSDGDRGFGKQQDSQKCSFCGNSQTNLKAGGTRLKPCPCRKVQYCDASCQKQHWVVHKIVCSYSKKGKDSKTTASGSGAAPAAAPAAAAATPAAPAPAPAASAPAAAAATAAKPRTQQPQQQPAAQQQPPPPPPQASRQPSQQQRPASSPTPQAQAPPSLGPSLQAVLEVGDAGLIRSMIAAVAEEVGAPAMKVIDSWAQVFVAGGGAGAGGDRAAMLGGAGMLLQPPGNGASPGRQGVGAPANSLPAATQMMLQQQIRILQQQQQQQQAQAQAQQQARAGNTQQQILQRQRQLQQQQMLQQQQLFAQRLGNPQSSILQGLPLQTAPSWPLGSQLSIPQAAQAQQFLLLQQQQQQQQRLGLYS